jgi:hypothetical protein
VSAGIGVAALVGIAAFGLSQSLPLRSHDEFGGSFSLTSRIAKIAPPEQGIFLFRAPSSCCFSAASVLTAPLMFGRGQLSAVMPPSNNPAAEANYVREFQKAFPGRPIYLVWDTPQNPALPGVPVTIAAHETANLPVEEVTNDRRPRTSKTLHYDLNVWRVG